MPAASKAKDAPADRADEFGGLDREGGEGWRPKEGEVLVGEVTEVGARWSDWLNAFYPTLTIKAEDGTTKTVHAFHAVLMRRVLQLRPLEGETVGIKYHGEQDNADGKTKSHIYTFKVKREAGEGPDPYAGFKAPGGKDVKEAVKKSKEVDADDDVPF